MTQIDEREYGKLIQKLEFFDTTRNNLLTFSFTAVLAVLGIALPVEMDAASSLICLLPYLLIYPFAARISYYRLASAHIGSFLRIYAKKWTQFEIGARTVPEGKGVRYSIIAWLVNHEMVLLGIVSSCVFYIKYLPNVQEWSEIAYICAVLPAVLALGVYFVTHTTFDYSKLVDAYSTEWNALQRTMIDDGL